MFPNFKRVFLETMFLKFVGRIEKIYLTDWLEILTDSFIEITEGTHVAVFWNLFFLILQHILYRKKHEND